MRKINIILIFLAFFTLNLMAQADKGDAAYEDLSYFKAIEYYEKALQKKKDPVVAMKLAHSYRLTGNPESAEKWYEFAINAGLNAAENRQYYAQVLLSNGKTAEARAQAELIVAANPNDIKAQNLIKACDTRDLLLKAGMQYSISPLSFNGPGADYCPTYLGENLVFTSDRGDDKAEKSTWTGRGFTSLFAVPLAGGKDVEALRGDVNGKYNDGAAVFNAEGTLMYFTRNNYQKEERRKSKEDVVNLILASARKSGENWIYEDNFPYNSPEFNSAHPALSGDASVLVFASDRPGGLGGMDLWKCEWTGSSWSMPVNLGPNVNTASNEIFPYLDPEGALIFASNGWPGLGALDVFISRFENGEYSPAQNVGAPINSSKDDFGCISRDGMKSGYFSSNINSSEGTEDIYEFKRKALPPAALNFKMNGVVVDKFTQIPLPGVLVTLENTKTGKTEQATTGENGRFEFSLKPESEYRVSGLKNGIATDIKTESTLGRTGNAVIFTQLEHNDPRFTLRGTSVNRKSGKPVDSVEVKLLNLVSSAEADAVTDAKGKFFFQLEQNSDYTITGQKAGVFTGVKTASTKGLDRSTDLYVQLTLNVDIIEIGKEITLDDIYFDVNKSDIRPDAAKILDNMADFMNKNQSLEVELTSHTDSRNSQEYNQALSQRRAESTMAYLVQKGIAASRMVAKGYGETKLVNRCADGVPCSEAEHQQNRRTAFRVLKY